MSPKSLWLNCREKYFLAYSPYALSSIKTKLTTKNNQFVDLSVELTDQSGVLLDSSSTHRYCNSEAELCASVGFWSDPNQHYIADDGVVRCVKTTRFHCHIF